MKKISIILLAAVSMLLFSCEKEAMNENETVESTESISFNLIASHPQTKAVKADWEAGDVVFVFFSGASAPNYLKMSFNGSAWTNLEYRGSVATPGALGLSNGDTGTMRAVYLPFGNTATVSADGTSYVFSTTYYTYYLTATLDYTVTAGEVSGSFEMVIPDNYVQFFVDDADAVDEAYALQCDAIIPTGIASIGENVAITETSDKTYADDIPGYAYDNGVDPKGYLFSGKNNGEYAWAAQGYYFAKKKVSDGSRHDYFVIGKTLSSHNAIKLPANGDAKWIAVGIDKTIEMLHKTTQASLGIWYTCNFNQTKPEALGPTARSWTISTDTRTAMAEAGVALPTTDQLTTLHDGCDFYWISIRGNEGAVLKGSNGTFLFLRCTQSSGGVLECIYYGQESGEYLYVMSGASTHYRNYSHTDYWHGVRGVVNP